MGATLGKKPQLLLILAVSAFLGLIIGVVIEITLPPTYKSTLSIKQNYET